MNEPSPSPLRPLALVPMLVSALGAAMLAQLAWRDPRLLLPLAIASVLFFVPARLARARMRKLLLSGDVKQVLGAWDGPLHRARNAETMAPLMTATAYAAYGWVEAARTSLARAEPGPAWEAAMEQRLFVEALLDAFEGERQQALAKALVLEKMPMPVRGMFARRRVVLLRQALSALARAFAHRSTASDEALLEKAAKASPLVHWAMRYAAAIVAVDHGRAAEAQAHIGGAPEWPRESAFRGYHEELAARTA